MDQMAGRFGELGELVSTGNKSCRYGFFSLHGGRSSGRYASLNVGLHVGDDATNVLANRLYVKEKMGSTFLLSALQVHGTTIHSQKGPLARDLEVEGYDALITDQPGIALMVQHADCQPVLLYDPVVGVIAAVHNGWRGSVQNILGEVVRVLVDEYSVAPLNICAIVGPSLGPCCAQFIHYEKELPEEFYPFRVGEDHFDFWQISKQQLMDSGIIGANISIMGDCTLCSPDYFSYRDAVRNGNGITGRNGSVIVLHKN
ncbi:polyphenol oxidase family protein [Desulforhopalus sp. 52FAK]